MNCREFQTALMSAVERREPVSFAARRHGETCASGNCGRVWREHLLLEAALTSWIDSVPRVDLQDAVLLQVCPTVAPRAAGSHAPELAKQQSRTSGGWLPVASLTAAVALLAALLQLPVKSQPQQVAEQLPVRGASQAIAAAGSAGEATVPKSSDQALREGGSRWTGWMEGATSRLTDTVTYVITPMKAPLDAVPGAGGPTNWLKRWEEQLEPLEDSLDRTLRGLFDSANAPAGEQTG